MMLIWNRLPTTEKLIEGEIQLLEDHRKANKEILTRHFYNMSNMMPKMKECGYQMVGRRLYFGCSCRISFIPSFRLYNLSLRE